MDWILTALSVWLVGGFYVDIWAHAHGRVDNTFFTPWHAFLYSGAASFGVVLGVAAIMGRPRSVPIRDTLAPPYRIAFLGSVLFALAGVLDLAWHTIFGFEVDVEALLSPTHLLLATSGMLMPVSLYGQCADMDAAQEAVLELGVPPRRIHQERFFDD